MTFLYSPFRQTLLQVLALGSSQGADLGILQVRIAVFDNDPGSIAGGDQVVPDAARHVVDHPWQDVLAVQVSACFGFSALRRADKEHRPAAQQHEAQAAGLDLLVDTHRLEGRRARDVLTDRDLTEDEKTAIARKVGIGAIKYADLSQNRIKEVVFDWDRMLALDGDSAPYLQYAFTRTRSILRKAGNPTFDPRHSTLLTAPEEQTLLKHIARFPDSIVAAAETCEPHRICHRLYRLAQDFSAFYDRVPVLKAETADLCSARLALVEMTGTVLRLGLGLLGIETAERM